MLQLYRKWGMVEGFGLDLMHNWENLYYWKMYLYTISHKNKANGFEKASENRSGKSKAKASEIYSKF